MENTQKAFLNKKIYSDRSLYGPKKQERIIFAASRLASDLESNLKRIFWCTFFRHFARTVRNTKNRSIRIVFRYKFTIKPVIILMKRTRLLNLKGMFRQLLCHRQFADGITLMNNI